MTVLDKFLSFAKALPADQLGAVEESLAELMASMSSAYDLTAEEIAETDRRLADPNPRFASAESIAKIFGKPFRA